MVPFLSRLSEEHSHTPLPTTTSPKSTEIDIWWRFQKKLGPPRVMGRAANWESGNGKRRPASILVLLASQHFGFVLKGEAPPVERGVRCSDPWMERDGCHGILLSLAVKWVLGVPPAAGSIPCGHRILQFALGTCRSVGGG